MVFRSIQPNNTPEADEENSGAYWMRRLGTKGRTAPEVLTLDDPPPQTVILLDEKRPTCCKSTSICVRSMAHLHRSGVSSLTWSWIRIVSGCGTKGVHVPP